MKCLDLTFPTPQENLACDEALVDFCEEGFDREILRFWEPAQHFVVLGYSNKTHLEINELPCRKRRIPVFRRCSGGGTVLQGPGCLNYSLILKIKEHGPLQNLTQTNAFIMTRHKEALEILLGAPVRIQGHTDLTLGGLKFSGNAQRRKKCFVLFHGTFLLDFDIPFVEKCLRMPSKQPPYRNNRLHKDFLTNLHEKPEVIKETLRKIWEAGEILQEIPLEKIRHLVKNRYSAPEWNFKF